MKSRFDREEPSCGGVLPANRHEKLLLLCLVIAILGIAACTPAMNACSAGASDCSSMIGELQIDNPRFQFPATQPNPVGQNFWIRGGDSLNAAWNSFVIYLAAPNVVCNSSSAISPPSCQRCDFINFKSADCPTVFSVPPGADLLQVSSFAGFSLSSPRNMVGHIVSGVVNGSFAFQPAENATLQLSTPINNRGLLAESKVFVLSGDMTETVTYRLDTLPQNVADVVFYSGKVPNTPVLEDNFSTNLRIAKVRILKGKPEAGPSQVGFHLKDASPVRPSRVVFIPDYRNDAVFAHDTSRCYSDPSTVDGDLDLTHCRVAYGSTAGYVLDATPAYLKSASRSTLTWVAEFRASEGGIPPSLGIDEVLAIEFTIQPN